MQKIELYIEGQRLELFKDESISLTDSIQNVKDIDKIFTEFSQSFSLPASKINNKIFKHYYNSDVQNGFDARSRASAKIELNSLAFKDGYIKLVGVGLKNNLPNIYRVVFYGSTISLKDILGVEKLQSLDLSANDRTYDSNDIRSFLQADATTNDVVVPLITHTQRLFYSYSNQQGNLTFNNDINGVKWNDLKFALRVDTIIKAITARHSELVFSDDFFTSTNAPYYGLFIWLHRKQGAVENLTGVNQTFVDGWLGTIGAPDATLTKMDTAYILQVTGIPSNYRTFELKLYTTSGNPYSVSVQKDGVEIYRLSNINGDATVNQFTAEQGNYIVYIESPLDITFSEIEWNVTYRDENLVLQSSSYKTGVYNFISLFTFGISQQIPEMKIIDFLKGLFKMFNLTAYVDIVTDKIVVKTLDSYYSDGVSHEITKYIDVSTSSVDVALPYREINFKYEGAKSFLASKFSQLSGKNWGDSSYDGGEKLDGSIYNVTLPFEHLQYERLRSSAGSLTSVQYGFFVQRFKSNIENFGEPYINKPLLFYPITQTNATPISFVLDDTTNQSLTTYNVPSNSVALSSGTSKANLNFYNETNEFALNNAFTDTLFKVYYSKYIKDVFNSTNRITKLSAYLPLNIIIKLNLNDSLIVSGKSYKINSIKTNLKTGKSEIELLNDL